MDVKDAIQNRRSIRKYSSDPVSDSMIREVIDAARLAPSGNNTQPSRYKVVTDPSVIAELKSHDIIRDKWAYDAPVIIVCCADPKAYVKRVEGWDDPDDVRALRDLNIASSYLVLRATSLGLGTCYCGWIKREEIKEILDIPAHYSIPYVITMGYPDESPGPRPRKGIDEIVL